jgi:hypothetical protein
VPAGDLGERRPIGRLGERGQQTSIRLIGGVCPAEVTDVAKDRL